MLHCAGLQKAMEGTVLIGATLVPAAVSQMASPQWPDARSQSSIPRQGLVGTTCMQHMSIIA